MTVALMGLGLSATLTGCSDVAADDEPSARELLDRANKAMSRLGSLTVDTTTAGATGAPAAVTSHVTTDLKSRCRSRVDWPGGLSLEQIRIGDTDYVRPNRKYLQKWSGGKVADSAGKSWMRTPASEAQAGDGLIPCTRKFAGFGKATKGGATRIDGTPARTLVVTTKSDEGGTYTFHVATEGKPYILRVVYKNSKERTTTSYSAFDAPLKVRAPDRADVVNAASGGN